MGSGSVMAKLGRGLYDERRRIVVPRRRRVDHALRDHLDTYLEDPVDGDVVQWDAASRNWIAGAPNPVRPICLITNAFGVHQNVSADTDTDVVLAHTRFETFAGMHVGNTIVAPLDGIYDVSYAVQWEDFNASGKPGGYRSSHVRVDGITMIDDHKVFPEDFTAIAVNLTMYASRPMLLAAGDVVDLVVLQDNTVDADDRLLHQTGERPALSIAYLGPSS